jgi:hypothetical protein
MYLTKLNLFLSAGNAYYLVHDRAQKILGKFIESAYDATHSKTNKSEEDFYIFKCWKCICPLSVSLIAGHTNMRECDDENE